MISQRDWNQNREVKMETTVVEKTVEQTTAPAHTRVDSSESQNQEQVLLPIPLAELEALIRRVVQEEVEAGLTRFRKEYEPVSSGET